MNEQLKALVNNWRFDAENARSNLTPAHRDTLMECAKELEAVTVAPVQNVKQMARELLAAEYLKLGEHSAVDEAMVERGAALSTSGRKDDPRYRAKIRAILTAALTPGDKT